MASGADLLVDLVTTTNTIKCFFYQSLQLRKNLSSYLAWSRDEMIPLWLHGFSGGCTSPEFALTDDSKANSNAPAPPTVSPATVANYNNKMYTKLILLTSLRRTRQLLRLSVHGSTTWLMSNICWAKTKRFMSIERCTSAELVLMWVGVIFLSCYATKNKILRRFSATISAVAGQRRTNFSIHLTEYLHHRPV